MVKYVRKGELIETDKPLSNEQLKRRITNITPNLCPDCGSRLSHTKTRVFCPKCEYKHGIVWTLDFETFLWTKHDRGA